MTAIVIEYQMKTRHVWHTTLPANIDPDDETAIDAWIDSLIADEILNEEQSHTWVDDVNCECDDWTVEAGDQT